MSRDFWTCGSFSEQVSSESSVLALMMFFWKCSCCESIALAGLRDVNLDVQMISWQVQCFVGLEVQFSWQGQYLVDLEVWVSWQVKQRSTLWTLKCRFVSLIYVLSCGL